MRYLFIDAYCMYQVDLACIALHVFARTFLANYLSMGSVSCGIESVLYVFYIVSWCSWVQAVSTVLLR